MSIFTPGPTPGSWKPSPMARGPFAGLQGGAVAGLLAGEIEAMAAERGWGEGISVSAWFLRPVPLGPLRTKITVMREGGRLTVVDNTMWADGQDAPCATARVVLSHSRPIEITGFEAEPTGSGIDPGTYAAAGRAAPHGGPWFMDAMEVHASGGVYWFRLVQQVIEAPGPLAQVLGPADWAHGLQRRAPPGVGIPNPNLTLHLTRRPRGGWIGVDPQTQWAPERGVGLGAAKIHDEFGVIGMVSMSVVMTTLTE